MLAREVGTPFYCYSSATLERHYKVFAAALPKDSLIAFSVKANGNLAVLKTLGEAGRGRRCGVGRRIEKGARRRHSCQQDRFFGRGQDRRRDASWRWPKTFIQFNVESEPELEALNGVALAMGKRAPVTLRINPDVDAQTHAKITTGTSETKFGIPFSQARAGIRKGRTSEGYRDRRRRRAYRQPDHRA